jgi:hypothetical protein
MAGDVAKIASAMSAAGVDPTDMVLIGSGGTSYKLRTFAGPRFLNEIVSSPAVSDTQLIGIQTDGLWTAFGDEALDVSVSNEALLHFDDANALPIVDGGSIEVPTRSLYQQGDIAIKIRGSMAWQVAVGSVQTVSGITW